MSVLGTSNTIEAGNTIRTAPWITINTASGGIQLGSGIVPYGITLTNVGTVISGDAFVGGIGTNAPFSGQGYFLPPDRSVILRIKNLNQVRVAASLSGIRVAWVGIDS